MTITLKHVCGKDAERYCVFAYCDLFKGFPYLYEGSEEEEKQYLDLYFNSQEGHFLLAFDDDRLIGFSSSLPFLEIIDAFKQTFISPENYLYIGEAMINEPYRGKGILREFSQFQETLAATKGYSHLIFASIKRSPSHPLCPQNYKPLDPLWERLGYNRLIGPEIKAYWTQSDTLKKEENILELWAKDLRSQ